jgi:hypothetical protein
LENGTSHRVPNQGSTVGGVWQPFCVSPETVGWGRKCEAGHCHGEAVRSVLAKVRGVLARFHAVAGIHSLACWDQCFARPQLLYRWRHQSGIFWIPPRTTWQGKLCASWKLRPMPASMWLPAGQCDLCCYSVFFVFVLWHLLFIVLVTLFIVLATVHCSCTVLP